MDFLQKNLDELIEAVQSVQKDLECLRSLLEKIEEQRSQNEELQALWSRVMEVAYRADLQIDSTLVARDINLLRIEAQEIYDSLEAQEIYDSISYGGEAKRATKNNEDLVGLHREVETITRGEAKRATENNEGLVGLHTKEVKTITCRLTSPEEQLVVVPIVGMPGLGKTTLADTVYNSPSVTSHFNIRAWCTVSQEYSNHNLLVQILSCIDPKSLKENPKMNEVELAEKLKQDLLRNRYLLVLDDLWNVEPWNFLQRVLPDEANRSRILITSRLQNLSLADSEAYHLRHLTDDESWKLLQSKLAGKEGHLAKLSEVGVQIAESCRGLPLTVVLVAGILATTAEDCLENVAKSLTSSIVLEDENCMKTLNLSYKHLPEDLRSCLLYLSAFQEDENIPVRRLLWLWISEGFVRKTEEKSLEDVANDYLKDLVDRSLVMVSKQRTTGGAKACRIHDLVHEFCVKKAKEENILHIIHRGKDPSSLTGLSNPHRVCDQNASNSKISEIMQFSPNIRSLLLFKKFGLMPKEENLGSKDLRVLDLGNLVFDAYFLMEVVVLVHLRYLALHIGEIKSIPSAIDNLSSLQTFLVRGNSRNTLLPETIWNIKTLKQLCTTSSRYGFTFPVESVEASPGLGHLDTLTLAIDPTSQNLQKILKKLPGIRRLKCFNDQVTINCDVNIAFDCLSKLESLSLHRFDGCGFNFPSTLKKLTLFSNRQPWSKISTIGKLSKLEVLKLLHDSFIGEEWEMKEGEFPNLRVLKLFGLHFRSWTATSDDHFCHLEELVVQYCEELEEVPSCFSEGRLKMIQVNWCRQSVARSVKQIQKDLEDIGNPILIVTECFDEEEEESIPSEAGSVSSQGL